MPKRRPRVKGPLEPLRNAAATRRIFEKLSEQHPGADTELHFSNAYELLVATILSAQCTDERVNQVTPALFRRYPDARALAQASTADLEPQIQSTGFFRAKSKSLKGMATALIADHGGEVPPTMEELVKLPGVGRKTANVVLGHALGVPGLPVDRHVLRVANRIGIARSDDPIVVEQQLCAALPSADWTRASDTLILHGRRICKPRPLCDRCAVTEECEYFLHVVSKERERGSKTPKPRRAATRRGTAAGEVPSRQEADPTSKVPQQRRAAKRKSTRRRGGDSGQKADPSSKMPQPRRAAKRQNPGRSEDDAGQRADPSSKMPKPRRAAKRRGTGRGGGAPRQSK